MDQNVIDIGFAIWETLDGFVDLPLENGTGVLQAHGKAVVREKAPRRNRGGAFPAFFIQDNAMVGLP
jgi:hypothetical protein